jgi:hypothetical protein
MVKLLPNMGQLTINPPPPPPPATQLCVYTVNFFEKWGGGQREGTVKGQQYTSIFPSSMGATVHKMDRKYQP